MSIHILRYTGFGKDEAFCSVNTFDSPGASIKRLGDYLSAPDGFCEECVRVARNTPQRALEAICGEIMAAKVVNHFEEEQS